MRNSLTPYDLPVLMTDGWKYGMTSSFLWNTDKNGVSWQIMVDDGEFLQFAQQLQPYRNMSPFQRMTHEEYSALFKERKRA